MRLKSYFSGTVEAAMELARKELGEEALLVNVRPATLETRYLGAYEVVFGLTPRAGAAFDHPPAAADSRAAARAMAAGAGAMHTTAAAWSVPPPYDAAEDAGFESAVPTETPVRGGCDLFRSQVAHLQEKILRLTALVRPQGAREAAGRPPSEPLESTATGPVAGPAPVAPAALTEEPPSFGQFELQRTVADRSPEPPATWDRLAAQDLDPGLARRVLRGEPLERMFSTDARLGVSGRSCAVVALIGPPGAGKTTTLVKLAARYGIGCHRSVQILTTDVHRIAAADQLRSLAAILGIGCEVVQTALALEQALQQSRGKDLILVDTPGLSSGDMEDGAELAQMLTGQDEIDCHLVLPASMKAADLARVAAQFAVFRPRKILFSRLDETSSYGTLVSLAARLDLPLSFLTGGQRMPDDLEEATVERVCDLVLRSPAMDQRIPPKWTPPMPGIEAGT